VVPTVGHTLELIARRRLAHTKVVDAGPSGGTEIATIERPAAAIADLATVVVS
jgi:hypothetical protein